MRAKLLSFGVLLIFSVLLDKCEKAEEGEPG